MDGSGCKNCPAYQKCTATYRGSRCAHNRATYGVESDPFTNADRIRSMTDEELAKHLMKVDEGMEIPFCQNKEKCWNDLQSVSDEDCMACMMEWLKQPATEDQWTE